MTNIKFEVNSESVKGEKYYHLFRVTVDGKDGYCIAVCDGDFSVHGVGNDETGARRIYELLTFNEVSALHLGDVIRDIESEIFM